MMSQKLKDSRVLVVLATLGKRTDFLKLALESIKNQGYKHLTVVMVYPMEEAATAQLAKEYGTVSLDDPGSMSDAVNLGIEWGWDSHDYVMWAGDDDLLMPGGIQKSVELLDANPNAVATYGYCRYMDSAGRALFVSRAGKTAPWIASWGPNLIPMPGSVMRVRALKKLDHLLDPSLKYSMDLDLFLRLKKLGKIHCVRQIVSCFRWHATSTTVAYKKYSLEETSMVKRRYLPKWLVPISFLWEVPVRYANILASLYASQKSGH